jgi:hypothetical protein
MPKPAKDLRLQGVTFEEALRRVATATGKPKRTKGKGQKPAKFSPSKN